MSPLLGGLVLLGLGIGGGVVSVALYNLLCRVIYGICVLVAIAVRCSQTPAEAQGASSWMTLAEEWYLKVPGVLK